MSVLINNWLLAWFLFAIWNKKSGLNFVIKMFFLADAVVSTVFLIKHPTIAAFLDVLSH